MFNAKLHRATVTECDLNYEGSISIDESLIKAAGMLPYEKVDIYNINNGERFSTYIIPAESGSGKIGLNGAAARLCSVGDKIIIVSYKIVASEDILKHKPKIILLDENNKIIENENN
jgi:aspartate 1-decarboxylase